jgi:DNA adenine methylase
VSDLRAPFPWFGGKRLVADLVWDAIGDVDNYVEPFAGSIAVLLGRPGEHERKAETVNDRDSYLCNFWRALSADPEAVAKWCDWPVNETDLLARHVWLVNEGRTRINRMECDPDFYDAKVAGWWVWGINSWIGSGWCQGNGPWRVVDGVMTKTRERGGQWRQLPHLGNAGQGVNRKLPHLGDAGQGVNRQRPHLGNRPPGPDLPMVWQGNRSLLEYFHGLARRLRLVRVCCGDWSRIVTNGALAYGDTVGVFLDPPYSGEVRSKDLYRTDDHDVAAEVREWAIANGDNPRYRIVLCGYEGEHAIPETWRVHSYSASKAYGTTAAVGSGEGNDANRHLERMWFSPGCLRPKPEEPGLFHEQELEEPT